MQPVVKIFRSSDLKVQVMLQMRKLPRPTRIAGRTQLCALIYKNLVVLAFSRCG